MTLKIKASPAVWKVVKWEQEYAIWCWLAVWYHIILRPIQLSEPLRGKSVYRCLSFKHEEGRGKKRCLRKMSRQYLSKEKKNQQLLIYKDQSLQTKSVQNETGEKCVLVLRPRSLDPLPRTRLAFYFSYWLHGLSSVNVRLEMCSAVWSTLLQEYIVILDYRGITVMNINTHTHTHTYICHTILVSTSFPPFSSQFGHLPKSWSALFHIHEFTDT